MKPEKQIGKAAGHIRANHRYCPKCNTSMQVLTVENTVIMKPQDKSDGLQADLNMKNYQTLFYCPVCRMKYTTDDLRKIELKYKKKSD